MKKLIIFDLDGTLAKSKSSIDKEIAKLLNNLLELSQVAIISGGDWPQFKKQVLEILPKKTLLKNLAILPTCGTKFYKFKKYWKLLYAEKFTEEEKRTILDNLRKAIKIAGVEIKKIWGDQIEDRGSQITFSALGQMAPLEMKEIWDDDFSKRKKITKLLEKNLKEFSVKMGGATSIDITKQGIDKAYGIKKLKQILSIDISEMIFIGDALFVGGNDNPVKSSGVMCLQVQRPNETKLVLKTLIACLEKTV